MRAIRLHRAGDLRVDDLPDPEPGPGEVLIQVEVALTDGTDLKAYRRGHPVLFAELPSRFGHEFAGIDELSAEDAAQKALRSLGDAHAFGLTRQIVDAHYVLASHTQGKSFDGQEAWIMKWTSVPVGSDGTTYNGAPMCIQVWNSDGYTNQHGAPC